MSKRKRVRGVKRKGVRGDVKIDLRIPRSVYHPLQVAAILAGLTLEQMVVAAVAFEVVGTQMRKKP